MPKTKTPRKAHFLAALRLACLTMEQWAKREGVTQGYVSNVLSGRRTNDLLDKKIAAFTEKQLRNVA